MSGGRAVGPWRRRRRVLVLALIVAAAAGLVVTRAGTGTADAGDGRLVYLQSFDGDFSYRLVVSSPRGGERQVLDTRRAVKNPSFSPDGERIAFTSPTNETFGRYGIYTVGADGSGVRQVSSPPYADWDPAWSPDGRHIAVSRDTTGNQRPASCCAIVVLRADGTGSRTVNGTRGGAAPAWSPDGNQIAFAVPGTGLRVVNADGSNVRTLVSGNISDPDWSPDGERIAFTRRVSATTSRLETVSAGGGTAQIRHSFTNWHLEAPAWAPDSEALHFVAYQGVGDVGRRSSSVWRQDRAGADPQRLIRADDRPIHGLDFHGTAVGPRVAVARDNHGAADWRMTDRLFEAEPPTRWAFTYGDGEDWRVLGDWDGDGDATAGVVTRTEAGLRWRLADDDRASDVAREFLFGDADAVPVVGDWDGDESTGVGVARLGEDGWEWELAEGTDSAAPSVARTFTFEAGAAGVPVTGDWNGDGQDTFGIVRPIGDELVWLLTDDGSSAEPSRDRYVEFGDADRHDVPVAGDFDGDGTATIGVVRPVAGRQTWLLATDAETRRPQIGQRFIFGATSPLESPVAPVAHEPWVPAPPSAFRDVMGTTHAVSIDAVAEAGIAGGYSDRTYRPALAVTRGQMATFLVRALDLDPADSQGFSDTAGHSHEGSIDAVAAAGVAQGFADNSFRPDEPVARGQMATFLTRGFELDPAGDQGFTDVDGHTHEDSINAVAAAGIAGGFGDGTYRPGDAVNRGQMATFLFRALDLAGDDNGEDDDDTEGADGE